VTNGRHAAPPSLVGRLAALTRKGTSLQLGGNVLVHASRIASTVVLTRLLTPGDFGIAGLITSLCTILVLVSDVGAYAFIVRHPRAEDRDFLDQLWTIRVIRGAVLALILLALSGPISLFIEQPTMQPAIAVSAFFFLLEGSVSLTFATAARAGQIGRLVMLDSVSSLAQICLAIVIAYFVRNYWAIIIATLLGALIKTILSFALFPGSARRLALNSSTALEIWSFGRFIAASGLLHLAITQSDKLILAKMFSLSELGLYVLAANIAAAPGLVLGSYSNRILYPVFARIHSERPQALSRAFYDTGGHLRMLYQVAAGGFVACAPLVIHILYDPNYARASIYLQILAVAALFKLTVASANDCLLALGQARHIFRLNLAKALWLILAALALGSLYGGIGVVLAVATVDLAAQIYAWGALKRAGVLRFRNELRFIAATIAGFALGYVVNWSAFRFASSWWV
jgi:O-antigen/teichoic acid export membrane protein